MLARTSIISAPLAWGTTAHGLTIISLFSSLVLQSIAIAEVHYMSLIGSIVELLARGRVPILHPAMLAIDCLLLEEFDVDGLPFRRS